MQFGDQLLARAASSCPSVGDTLRAYGDRSLREFLATIVASQAPALQDRGDLWAAVASEAEMHYGSQTAAAVVDDLRTDPIVPTSNHYGIDTVADSIQGTLLFSLRRGHSGLRRPVVVFGFGSVSMNNPFSYPMGLQLYDPQHGRLVRLPQRLPILPNRLKLRAVCTAGPFDEHMVLRAQDRLRRMAHRGEVTPFCANAARDILEEVFAPAALAWSSYSDQSAAINDELWRRSFQHWAPESRLVQLQVERICSILLRRDLYDPTSLLYQLFFVTEVRERLLAGLDGARACWQLELLQRRLCQPGAPATGGTVFFWGLSESGNRVQLTLEARGSSLYLVGVSQGGKPWRTEFSADGIGAELEAGRLLPSLFTCFTVLAFARGLSCVGGYYQAEYLPVMQNGVVDALSIAGEYRDATELVAQVPTRICVAGLQGLVRPLEDGSALPAGPVELAGMGGVAPSELDVVETTTVREAYLLAFTDIFDQLVPGAPLPPDWVRRLAVENGKRRFRSAVSTQASLAP